MTVNVTTTIARARPTHRAVRSGYTACTPLPRHSPIPPDAFAICW
jgi:hypothetical protein